MRTGFTKQIIYLLAVMLVLLPFTSVYSFSGHSGGGMRAAMQVQADMIHCQQADHAQCPEQSDQASSDDNCCNGHCDASFSAPLCLTSELKYDFTAARIYTHYTPLSIPDPVIFAFLRPPLAIS